MYYFNLRTLYRVAFLLCALTPTLISFPQAAFSQGTTRGIFIGIDRTEEGVGNGYSARSAAEVHSLWTNYLQLDQARSYLLINENAKRADIRRVLFDLRNAHPDDRFVVYLAVPALVEFTDSLTAAGFFLPYDGVLMPLPDSSAHLISAREVQDAVITSPAREITVFIDTPVSGVHATSWPPLEYDAMKQPPLSTLGKHLLVAGRWGDTFFLNEREQSPFVTSMTTALTSSAADANQDAAISFTELGQYIREDVARQTDGNQFVQVRSYEGALDTQTPLPAGYAEAPTAQDVGSMRMPRDSLWIQFDTSPVSATIYVNDTLAGQTPFTWSATRWEDATIHLHAPGYLPWEEVITPDTELHTSRTIPLLEDRVLLTIDNLTSRYQVFINGVQEPAAGIEPIELPTGDYHVMIRQGNDLIIDRRLTLDPETSTRLTFERKFTLSPAIASFFVPGLGQYTQDARIKGIGFAVATFSALAVSLNYNLNYLDSKELYFEAREGYLQARTRPLAHAMRAEMLARYDEVIENNDRRFYTLMAAAVIQSIGVLDALIFHSRRTLLHSEQKTELTPFIGAHHDGLQIGLQIGL